MHIYDEIITPADWLCAGCGLRRGDHAICPTVYGEGRVILASETATCVTGEPFTREHHEHVAMLRIKNEERYIGEVLEAALPLCSHAFVMDDHSDDETVRICESFGNRVSVYPSPFEGFNEARDKNWLLDQVLRQCEPKWILCVDGDEVLEKRGAEIVRENVAANPEQLSYSLKIVFLWNDRNTARVDRIYDFFWRPSLFRPFIPRPDFPDDIKLVRELRFMATPFGRRQGKDAPNLHCSSVPQRLLHNCQHLPARLKHYGYLEREQRVAKLDRYNAIDWLDAAEDCYRHMCAGDNVRPEELPRVLELVKRGTLTDEDLYHIIDAPVDAYLVHAGPVEFRAFVE